MGNIDSRSQFNGGYIYVRTDRPYYYPGNFVQGKVYIRLDYPMNASHLEFRIKGKETSSYWYDHQEGDRRERRKKRSERMIIQWKANCFTFPGPLMPGDYQIMFQFTIPEGIPASIFYKDFLSHDKPKAKVAYHVKAVLHTHEHQMLKYKQLLVVHEPPVPF